MRISLVIPTRERVELLRHCLLAALDVPDPDLEVIVSDNNSRDETSDFLAELSDPRLRVVRPEGRVSMRRNFETGLAAATGDYVIVIGDDDGVTAEGMAMLRRVLERDRPEAVSWEMIHYTWPTDEPGADNGVVQIKAKSLFGGSKRRSPKGLLANAASARLRKYTEGANIYHGCVSQRLIDRVRSANGGVYFAGSIPDVYACFANLAHMSEGLVWLGHPASFGGSSIRSNGAAQVARTKISAKGAKEVALFVSESSEEAAAAGIDLAVPSVDALTVDMIGLVNRHHANNRLAIDYRAWSDRVLRRLALQPRARYERGVEIWRDYVAARGGESWIEDAIARRPHCGSEDAGDWDRPRRSRVKPLRVTLSDPRGLATVRDAAKALNEVIGSWSPRRGAFRGPRSWFAWRGARERAGALIQRWSRDAAAGG